MLEVVPYITRLRRIIEATNSVSEIAPDLLAEAGGDDTLARLLQAARDLDTRDYEYACEAHAERYAEAGSSWCFGGGNPLDANLAVYEAAGPAPTRAAYGLPPIGASMPPWTDDEKWGPGVDIEGPTIDLEDDFPF